VHATEDGVNEGRDGTGTHEEGVGKVDDNAETDKGGARCATEGSDEVSGPTTWGTLVIQMKNRGDDVFGGAR